MRKAFLSTIVAGVFLSSLAGSSWAAEKKQSEKSSKAAADEKSQLVTEGEFAKWLVQVLGLSRLLPPTPTENECFQILLQNNISPRDGWDPDNVVTLGNLARIVVQAMGRQSEVEHPEKDESWIQYLKSVGIEFGTIGEAVENLGLLSTAYAPEAIVVNTDPLGKIARFRPIDEQQLGLDFHGISRPPELQPVTPPPAPPRPVVRPPRPPDEPDDLTPD
jgi:hypothetical protein